jgi:hypothetical protein
MIKEAAISVVQAFRMRLIDAGANRVRNDSDDTLFEQEGFYVP